MVHRSHWMTYIRERFPIATYLVLSSAITWSAAELFGISPFNLYFSTSLSLLGILLFFFELRLMDECKDFDKDKIAHPNRPLPRGLLSLQEVRKVIALGLGAMVIFSLTLFFLGYSDASWIYLVVTIYLFLMYREFFIGDQLVRAPFLYGCTHQIILLPLLAFSVALFHGESWMHSSCWLLGITILGAFFTYELCRKLDPEAHPILNTYPQVYGKKGTFLRTTFTSIVAVLGSTGLGFQKMTTPFILVTWLASVGWLVRPHRFKFVESLASISLLVHLACAPLMKGISRWF